MENNTSVQGWKWIDGNWYFFDTDGKMYTSWLEYKNRWYFLSTAMDGENGKMLTGWNWIDGYSYYFDQEGDVGAMAAATTTKDGYRVDQNGRWVHENSTPVFQRNQGLQSKPFVSLSANSEKNKTIKETLFPNDPVVEEAVRHEVEEAVPHSIQVVEGYPVRHKVM